MRERCEAVLFDFGNTLFAHAPLADTITGCSESLGRDVSRSWSAKVAQRIEAAAQAPDEVALGRDLDSRVWDERWRALYSLADDESPGLGAAVHRSMHAAAEWVPYERTLDVLYRLSVAGMRIGVVSNTGWDVRSVFVHHGVAELVHTFVLSYEVGCVKPSREIFDVACERLGSPVERVLMVGDDPRADAGATAAGLTTLLVPAAAPGIDNGLGGVLGLVGVSGV